MPTKLLIVNNGLKNLRGHYFETAIAVADAARRRGLRPYLAAHVSCPADVIPPWLDFHPVCRTDHWMAEGHAWWDAFRTAPPQPPGPTVTAEDVATGQATIADYLHAFRLPTPPVAVPPSLAKRLLRAITPAPLRAGLRRSRKRPPILEAARDELTRAGQPHEYLFAHLVRADLLTLLDRLGITAADHVFLPTTHPRELLGIAAAIESLSPDHCPTFHLEFRHLLDFENLHRYDPGAISPHDMDWLYRYTACHRIAFDVFRRRLHPNVRLYTDTEELSGAYTTFTGLPFDTLPIPFRTELVQGPPREPGGPLRLTATGDMRDEKGSPWLPLLVEELRAEAEAGRVRFAFQTGVADPVGNPATTAALTHLRALNAPYVELHGDDGPLSPEAYFRLVASADVLLCPYDPIAYRRRSSGTLAEAIAVGIPTVVPAGTWLARQQPPETGATCHDETSFLAAVRTILSHYPRYLGAARAARDRWLAAHTPDRLVSALLGRAGTADRAA